MLPVNFRTDRRATCPLSISLSSDRPTLVCVCVQYIYIYIYIYIYVYSHNAPSHYAPLPLHPLPLRPLLLTCPITPPSTDLSHYAPHYYVVPLRPLLLFPPTVHILPNLFVESKLLFFSEICRKLFLTVLLRSMLFHKEPRGR